MSSNVGSAKHGLIFAQLIVLAGLSVLSGFLGLSPIWHTVALFAIAFSMAGLVVAQYMGLKGEGPLIYLVFFIPVVLFAVLVVPLIPDIAHQIVPFMGGR
jgi:caa(3)-type oxidase subunit IV